MGTRQVLRQENGHGIAKALPEDYSAVKAMSKNIYNGFDYLLPIYQKWIDMESEMPDKVKNLVLLDDDGQVLGYQSYFIFENGKSVFAQALRISPSCRGKGIGKLFTKLSNEYLKTFLHPDVGSEQIT